MPLQHVRPEPHAVPQAPQLASSLVRSTQVPPQQVSDAPQTEPPHVHVPPTHVSPLAQAFPQVPQLAESVWISTQTPEQSTPPPGH